jgi:hypothetical protein
MQYTRIGIFHVLWEPGLSDHHNNNNKEHFSCANNATKKKTPQGGTERDLLDSSSSHNGSLFDPIFDNAQKVLKKTSSKKKEKPLKAALLKHGQNDEATSHQHLCSPRASMTGPQRQ